MVDEWKPETAGLNRQQSLSDNQTNNYKGGDKITTDEEKVFPVEDIMNELVQASMSWNQYKFAEVFYGLGPNEDYDYVSSKWASFQRNGFVHSYAHLDGPNSRRVCEWIAQRITDDRCLRKLFGDE